MHKQYDIRRYPFAQFDEHLSLKAPWPLLLVIAFLCRELLLPLFILVNSLTASSLDMSFLASPSDHIPKLLAGAPAALVLYGFLRRSPDGGFGARWSWTHGRWLLLVSASLHLFLHARATYPDPIDLGSEPLASLTFLLDVLAILYVAGSRRVKHSFSDFPASTSTQHAAPSTLPPQRTEHRENKPAVASVADSAGLQRPDATPAHDSATANVLPQLQEAAAALSRNDLDASEALCNQALDIDASNFEALHLLGVNALTRGHADRGIHLIGRSLSIQPQQPLAHANLGLGLLMAKKPEQAVASFDRALQLRPDFTEMLNYRGEALLDLSHPEQALASFDRAIALQPDFAEAFCNRGAALLALGQTADALTSIERALKIKPHYPAAAQRRSELLCRLDLSEHSVTA